MYVLHTNMSTHRIRRGRVLILSERLIHSATVPSIRSPLSSGGSLLLQALLLPGAGWRRHGLVHSGLLLGVDVERSVGTVEREAGVVNGPCVGERARGTVW